MGTVNFQRIEENVFLAYNTEKCTYPHSHNAALSSV